MSPPASNVGASVDEHVIEMQAEAECRPVAALLNARTTALRYPTVVSRAPNHVFNRRPRQGARVAEYARKKIRPARPPAATGSDGCRDGPLTMRACHGARSHQRDNTVAMTATRRWWTHGSSIADGI